MLPDRVSEVGSAHFAAIFGAIEVTGGNHVIVYLTSLSKTAEEQLSSLGAPGQVSFKLTSHNRDQLLYLQAEVTASAPWLRAAGVQLVTWFPGVNGDGLEHIGVYDLNRSKAKLLYSHFGSRNIVLQNVNRNELPVATDSGNRVYDSMPWNGGDNITSHGIGCTSGVGIDYFGIQYMLTASHCYDPGWAVYNEFAGVSRPNNLMGIEKSRDIRNGGDDTALIAMPVSNRIWAGAIGVAHSVVVAGAATNLVGDVVYNEGAYSGQLASVVQNNYAGCITSYYDTLRAYRTECNIIWARSTGIANQEGDSGGPMVRWIAGRLYVTGIVSAGTGSVTCQYNAPYSNECFHNVYYTAATEILAIEYPGATIG
jgi:Trypsin